MSPLPALARDRAALPAAVAAPCTTTDCARRALQLNCLSRRRSSTAGRGLRPGNRPRRGVAGLRGGVLRGLLCVAQGGLRAAHRLLRRLRGLVGLRQSLLGEFSRLLLGLRGRVLGEGERLVGGIAGLLLGGIHRRHRLLDRALGDLLGLRAFMSSATRRACAIAALACC